MIRPRIVAFKTPETLSQLPLGACFESGHLVSSNAAFRTHVPICEQSRCVACMLCYLVCPEGAISRDEGKIIIDPTLCKGCGICSAECPKNALLMTVENTHQ
jgi:2-oxoacid:acceptor oxidoreductase delta subunit (pyruvate/2-ketoisovalerate family)